jgi:hypothetical protein
MHVKITASSDKFITHRFGLGCKINCRHHFTF